MAQLYCQLKNCQRQPLPVLERLTLSFIVGGVIVAKPLVNALGIDMTENLMNASLTLRFSVLFPILAWALSIYLAWRDRTDHHMALLINAMGLPGTLLGLALIFSK